MRVLSDGLRLLLWASLLSCASQPVPRDVLPSAKELQREAFGSFMLIRHWDGSDVHGELIAVEPLELYLLAHRDWVQPKRYDQVRPTLVKVPISEIREATLVSYRTVEDAIGLWGLGGTVSTLSHGGFLILSAPTWVISTAIAGSVESRSALLHYPDQSFDSFRPFARFPQGMPPGMNEQKLLPGPAMSTDPAQP